MTPSIKIATLLIFFYSIFGGIVQPAYAEGPQCAPRDSLLRSLSSGFDETPRHMGVTSTGALLEILSSPTGSWTIIVTIPDGPTCMVASGDGWRESPLQVSADPEA